MPTLFVDSCLNDREGPSLSIQPQRPDVTVSLWVLTGKEQEAPVGRPVRCKLRLPPSRGLAPLPAADDRLLIRSCVPFRFELNTMRSPCGDHTGITSSAASDVNRLNTPRFVSSNQMSTFPSTARYSAARAGHRVTATGLQNCTDRITDVTQLLAGSDQTRRTAASRLLNSCERRWNLRRIPMAVPQARSPHVQPRERDSRSTPAGSDRTAAQTMYPEGRTAGARRMHTRHRCRNRAGVERPISYRADRRRRHVFRDYLARSREVTAIG